MSGDNHVTLPTQQVYEVLSNDKHVTLPTDLTGVRGVVNHVTLPT